METKIDVLDNIVLDNTNNGWSAVTSIDFGGANVEFYGNYSMATSHPWKDNKVITSISGGNITNVTGSVLFSGCSELTAVSMNLTNALSADSMYKGCLKLQTFSGTAEKVKNASYMFWQDKSLTNLCVEFGSNLNNITQMLYGCSSLTEAQIIVPNSYSAKTISDFGVSDCPATAYTYVDTIDENLVRLTFRSTERPTYTIDIQPDDVAVTTTDDNKNNIVNLAF